MPMTLEAKLALEWWRASGARTMERLAAHVDHWLDTNGVRDPGQREYTHAEAKAGLRGWEVVES